MELEDIFNDNQKLRMLMHPYYSAVNIMKAKLEIIDNELKNENDHSPIHVIQSRIKTPSSILEKLERKKYPITKEGFYQLNDIAGIRVVCHYINDVQYIAQLLLMHEDTKLVKKNNYIDYPKESGYRSLHLVIEIPVHLRDGKVYVPIEVQLRTIAMDCWASLEHELLYKNRHQVNTEIHQRLKDCAVQMAMTDITLQKIYQELNN